MWVNYILIRFYGFYREYHVRGSAIKREVYNLMKDFVFIFMQFFQTVVPQRMDGIEKNFFSLPMGVLNQGGVHGYNSEIHGCVYSADAVVLI